MGLSSILMTKAAKKQLQQALDRALVPATRYGSTVADVVMHAGICGCRRAA